MRRYRALLLATLCAATSLSPATVEAQRRPRAPRQPRVQLQPGEGGTVSAVRITGNQRIEEGTIRSYMLIGPGDAFNADRLDRSLKTLYATGLFQDVTINREGSSLVVKVVENPIVNRIAFEGNRKLTDEQLRTELQLRARAVFTPQLAQADRQRILDLYAKRGRFAAMVEPKIIRLDQNRVDVVFEISESDTTLISRIAFVGNRAFSESKLREVIVSREQAFYRILSTSDQYDPEKTNFDKELLRRFYLKNGYADFEVKNATAELSTDRKAFFVTFTLNEGERYRIGTVAVDNKLRNLSNDELRTLVPIQTGDVYDGDAVERTTTALQDAVQNRGYAFVDVKPRIARDPAKKTVDLVFDVAEGPRVFVERLDIVGNTRTQDKVIRREFRIAEGDPFNAGTLRNARVRLQDLGYFNAVTVQPSPGSSSDKAIVTATVDEKATGELTFGGGYSTDAGALLNAGLRERNLVGTGIDASLNGTLAQKRSQIDLSVTDPYFLDRNLVTGFDLFRVSNNNQDIAAYSESRTGGSLRLGYEFNEHLRQAWTYSLINRNVFNVQPGASVFIQDQNGSSLLSQIGQTLSFDYRDSRTDPHEGFLIRLGTDFAGIGGSERYLRGKVDANYYYPFEQLLGDPDYVLALAASVGYLQPLGRQEKIIDRFFLGGDNLRGFQSAGAGPHARDPLSGESDSIGGRFIWTQTTEFRFPLPVSADLGITGRAFVDVGALSQVSRNLRLLTSTKPEDTPKITDNASPRMGVGVGISWKTPFGLINIDLAQAVIKKTEDKTQFFRFGFGTRF